jgi:3-hydroxyacyl-CoA dehydrogenase
MPSVRRIAVVGPGLMGLGTAQVAAAAGLQVLLVGRDAAAAAAGHARLSDQLARQVDRGRLAPQRATDVRTAVVPAKGDADIGEADTAAVLGLGVSPEHGGPLRAIERVGLERFVRECDARADAEDRRAASRVGKCDGKRFRPSNGLRCLAAAGRGLDDWRDGAALHGALP